MKTLILSLTLLTSISFANVKVLAFAGSTRDGSFNKKLVQEAAKMAKELKAEVTVIDLKDFPMPFYDADLEIKEGLPQNAKKLRDLMIAHDAVIIASPQYNASIPAVLKNALDWASRNEEGRGSKEAFKGKKFAIMSTSPSVKGGARGLTHLRAVIEDCGGQVIQDQVSIGQAPQTLEDPANRELVLHEIQSLINRN